MKLRWLFPMLLVSAMLTAQGTAPRSFTPVPPMGWNSWDCYGTTVTEAEVKANADYMAQHLKPFGWTYIVVDIQWYEPNAKAHGYRTNAELVLDGYGRLMPAENRFPSASGGKGFTALAEYIHRLGLKFGIHVMRGIPRQAVRQNLPVKGTKRRARDIADTASICPWNTDMYGVRTSSPEGKAYYRSLIDLYNSWGVDYIKVDDMTALSGNPADAQRLSEIAAISDAIKQSGRPIVLSLSPGPAGIEQADFLKEHAQLWRISDDFWDKWSDIVQQFGYMRTWQGHSGPTSWPDADMLPLGRIGLRAERGDARPTRFTPDEQYTLMSLWSLFRSPLMFGGNLPDNDPSTLALITNPEVLAVNQSSANGREVMNRDSIIVWSADDPLTQDRYIGIFSIADEPEDAVTLTADDLGLENEAYRLRDLWSRSDLGIFNRLETFTVNRHGVRLLRFRPVHRR